MRKVLYSALSITVLVLSITLPGQVLIANAYENQDPIVPTVTVSKTDNFSGQQNMYFVFDAEYYAKTYPDAVEEAGTDFEALFNHYLTYGIKNGYNASKNFNLDAYKENNPELVEMYGNQEENESLYFTHYLTTGKYEGLKAIF